MITVRGSILVKFRNGEEVARRMSKKLYIGSILALIIGSVGLAAYLAVSVGHYMVTETDLVWADALLVFALPFGFGLVFLLTLNRQYKQAAAMSDCEMQYEFFSDGIVLREFRRGEQTGTAKFLYSQVMGARQNKEFLFFSLIKPASYPLLKSSMTAEELNTVKSLLRLPSEGEPLPLSPFSEQPDALLDEIKRPQAAEDRKTDSHEIDGIFTLSGEDTTKEGNSDQIQPENGDLS